MAALPSRGTLHAAVQHAYRGMVGGATRGDGVCGSGVGIGVGGSSVVLLKVGEIGEGGSFRAERGCGHPGCTMPPLTSQLSGCLLCATGRDDHAAVWDGAHHPGV